MADIKIVVDTAADMPKELREENDIGIINFLTVFGDDAFVAGEDITNEEFYKKLTTEDITPTTAQTPYQTMYDYFLEESKKHETVIYFSISAKASGQNHTAHMVVEDIKENDNPDADIRIVDTKTYSLFIALMALTASQLVKEGKSADEIIDSVLKINDEWKAFLLVDTLKYLEKGGRLNKASAIVGTLLDIKPVLTVCDGLIGQADKLRGKKKLHKKLAELIAEYPGFDDEKKEFMILHSDKEAGDALIEALEEEFGDINVTMISEFGPIVGTHTGPGCAAAIFRLK